MPKPTECAHEWETTNGRMHICKHCGVGRRQPDQWPVSDVAIDVVTVLNKSAFVVGAKYERTLHGDRLEIDVATTGGGDHATLKFDYVGPEVYQSLVESGMRGRWSLVLVSEEGLGGSAVKELYEDANNAITLLRGWMLRCKVALSGKSSFVHVELIEEGARLIDKARAAWLRGVFGEVGGHVLCDLRNALRCARRERLCLEAAARLLSEEQDAVG